MWMLGFEVSLLAIFSMVFTVVFLWWSTATFHVFKKMGVPYKTPLPLVGNSLALFTQSLPDWDLKGLEEFGKVFGRYDGRAANLVVADADFIKQMAIKDFSNFTNRRKIFVPSSVLQRMVSLIEDDHWKHVRNSMTPAFTSGKLKQMVIAINDCDDQCVEHIKKTNSAPFAIKTYMTGYTMDVIARTAFGIEIDSQNDLNHPFLKHGGAIFGSTPMATKYEQFKQLARVFIGISTPQIFQKAMERFFDFALFPPESILYFEHMIEKMLDQRMFANTEKRPDFVQSCFEKLVDLEKVDKASLRESNGMKWTTEGMTRDEIISNAVLFLLAGHETTATTLQFFFYQMTQSPEIQEKLYEHISIHSLNDKVTYEELNKMDYLDQCLHEVMRMYPAAPRFDRVASADTVVNGVHIPKGMFVTASVYAIHHNPTYWPEPEKFIPERFASENKEEHHQYTWLPFGIGNRNCIGMRLALLEVKLAIVKIIKNFVMMKSASTPDKIEFKSGTIGLVAKQKLELRAVPRSC